ncbi:MAG TPA: VTT domain-containing protein [Clostridia bacterium]|nr:VTT domain-containing protein [Clostridia bacterium]
MKNELKKHQLNVKSKRIKFLKLLVFTITIFSIIAIILYLFPTISKILTTQGQQDFKEKIDSLGIFGGLILFGLQLAQVVLVILPGEPIEILAGMCYGVIGGTIFITASVFVITSGITILVKKFGKKYIYNFFEKEKIDKIENSKFYKNPAAIEIILIILFMIPGTPKDLLVYLGGILPVKYWRFVLISTFARFPSVISSTIAGANVAYGNWQISLLTYGITFIVTGIMILIVNHFDKEKITSEAINTIK